MDQPPCYAPDVNVGAPPDEFNLGGQDWGLPPLHPAAARKAAGYAPFIATLRANMRHAGALRIDHVMGLMRLFWVPRGHGAARRRLRRYPFDDLLGILALESERHRCLVIGEDLGTVARRRSRRAAATRECCRTGCCISSATGDGEFAAARQLSGAGARHHRHARPADAGGLLGGRRHRCAQALRLYPDANAAGATAGCAIARSRDG